LSEFNIPVGKHLTSAQQTAKGYTRSPLPADPHGDPRTSMSNEDTNADRKKIKLKDDDTNDSTTRSSHMPTSSANVPTRARPLSSGHMPQLLAYRKHSEEKQSEDQRLEGNEKSDHLSQFFKHLKEQ
jgi:hypothetical protein